MRKLILPILALLLALGLALPMALPVAAGPTGNLLENPGAEDGVLAPWDSYGNIEVLSSIVESCGQVNPNSGSRFFGMGLDGQIATSWISQTIDLTALGGAPVTLALAAGCRLRSIGCPKTAGPRAVTQAFMTRAAW